MICPRCSAESPPGQKFCGECGAALALACPSCGTASPPGQKFCGECGTALAVTPNPGGLASAASGPLAAGTAATSELLALLDACPPGRLAPMQRAERDLARARLAVDPDVGGPAFAAAIAGLRQHSTPYHLADGLLDHAAHLAARGDDQAAAAAVGEAVGIAERLGCRPLLDRAGTLQPARPRTGAS